MKKKSPPKSSAAGVSALPHWLPPVALILLTLIVWWPVTRLDFVNWDDVTYLTANPAVQEFRLSELLTGFFAGNYHPLTMLSLALEAKLGGMNPGIFHRTNLLLHAVNVVLVYRLFLGLRFSVPIAVLLSLLFGLHPLRVESVAWVAERKDVLYAAFWLGAALAWLSYRKSGNGAWALAALGFFVLSCLSKAMAVTLVPFLLVLDYIQGHKFQTRDYLLYALLTGVALATGILAFVAQGDAVGMGADFSIPERMALVAYGFWFYVLRTLAPVSLSAFYPYPDSVPVFWYVLPVLTVGVAYGLYRLRNRMLTGGLLAYAVIILPVLQIIPVGTALVADRYSYLSVLGLLVMTGWGIVQVERRFPGKEMGMRVTGLLLASVLAWSVRDRIPVWQNSITLYENVLQQFPDYSIGQVNYGNALRDKGDWKGAERAYCLAIVADSQNDLPWNNLGILASFRGQPERAVYFYGRAADLKPDYPVNYYNIATVWFNQGKADKALPYADKALAVDSLYGEALHLRGVLLQQLQRYPESVQALEKARQVNPYEIKILNDLGTTWFYSGNAEKAEAAFRESLALNTDANPNAYNNLGFVLFNSGRQPEAIEMYRKAAAQGHPEAQAYLRQLGNIR